jgi:hypothetical protein
MCIKSATNNYTAFHGLLKWYEGKTSIPVIDASTSDRRLNINVGTQEYDLGNNLTPPAVNNYLANCDPEQMILSDTRIDLFDNKPIGATNVHAINIKLRE